MLLATGTAGYFWIVAITVRTRVISAIGTFWDGPVGIDEIHINSSGEVKLKGIKLKDEAGKARLLIGGAEMNLLPWPSMSPKPTKLQINSPAIHLFLQDGGVPPALKLNQAGSASRRDYADIAGFTVSDMRIHLSGEDTEEVVFKGTVTGERKNGVWSVHFTETEPVGQELLQITGRLIPQTRDAELSIEMNRVFQKDEVTLLLMLAQKAPDYAARFRLDGNFTLRGSIKEPRNLEAAGKAELSEAMIFRKEAAILKNLNTKIGLDGSRINVENINADFCGGKLTGSLFADKQPNGLFSMGGRLGLKDADLVEMTGKLDAARKFTKGKCSGEYEFSFTEKDLQSLRAGGAIFVDNADLQVLPVIPKIFAAVGLKEYDPLRASDAVASFTMTGPEVTIDSARLSNRWAAIRAESGGKVHLETSQVDAYVVAAPLKQIDDIMQKIPVINLFVDIKDKLVRLRIKGNWSQPEGVAITKEPIKDVRDGTVDFIKGVLDSGGQITKKMLDALNIFSKESGKDASEKIEVQQ